MNTHPCLRARQSGISMIEVLITFIILLVSLLGLAGMMMQSQRAETESYQRVQALIFMQDMVARINANRKVASCYAVSTAATGSPYFGTGNAITPVCLTGSASQNALAVSDMNGWNALLLGTNENGASGNSGGILGARGCVSADTSTVPTTYTVNVAWQGLGSTAAPPANVKCASGTYGDESRRRVVGVSFKIATLAQ